MKGAERIFSHDVVRDGEGVPYVYTEHMSSPYMLERLCTLSRRVPLLFVAEARYN